MTLTLELPTETEVRLRQKAQAQGLAVEEFAVASLNQIAGEQTLAEALVGPIGVLHSDGSMDARDSKKVFGEYLAEKQDAGNL
ncbi:MAG: hypothetical protein ACRYFS_01230 [Janthinobacterium lividum]